MMKDTSDLRYDHFAHYLDKMIRMIPKVSESFL